MGFFPFNFPMGPQGPQGPQSPQGPMGQAPTAPPPPFEPQQPVSAFAVDPRAISRCLFQYTFIWLINGDRFWFFPIFVGRTSVAGYRWTGRFWVYFGVDLNRISSFTCF